MEWVLLTTRLQVRILSSEPNSSWAVSFPERPFLSSNFLAKAQLFPETGKKWALPLFSGVFADWAIYRAIRGVGSVCRFGVGGWLRFVWAW